MVADLAYKKAANQISDMDLSLYSLICEMLDIYNQWEK